MSIGQVFLLLASASLASAQYKALNPRVSEIVGKVSEQRIESTLKKLESFGTRNLMSQTDDPAHGIGAARTWLLEQFRAASPRLQVSSEKYKIKKIEGKNSRVPNDVELYNLVAVLPGKGSPEQRILITAHYDSIVLQNDGEDSGPHPDPNTLAPGVTDDASGVACILELARILSQYEFEKTLVFVAFDGEEEGLLGSTLFAARMKNDHQKIEAVLNNDIIGSDVAGDGTRENRRVRVFSDDPPDSPSRSLARYIREIGPRYVPEMAVETVFRADRFGRDGDHTAFHAEGFAAVRLSSVEENFAHQHTASDTFEHTSVPYIARVTKLNGAIAAALAWAPKPPALSQLTRGKSGYDAALEWKQAPAEADLAGFVVVRRSTTSPWWEQETLLPVTYQWELPNLSIDYWIFGVKALDREGNESLVSPYVPPAKGKRTVDIILDDLLDCDQ